jgi:hypothetical protein
MQRTYSRAPSDASAPVCSPPTRPATCCLCGADRGTEALRYSGLGHAFGLTRCRWKLFRRNAAPFGPLKIRSSGSLRGNSAMCARTTAPSTEGKATVRNPASDFGLSGTRSPFRSSANFRTTCTTAVSRSTSRTRRATSSPQRRPVNAAKITSAGNRRGISAASPPHLIYRGRRPLRCRLLVEPPHPARVSHSYRSSFTTVFKIAPSRR